MHLDHDQLALLALGDDEMTDDVRAHLDTCAQCDEVYTKVRDIVDIGADTRDLRDLPAPPPRVWAAIAAEIGRPLPEQERVAAPVRPPARPRRSRRWTLALAAAVVAIAATLGITTALHRTTSMQVVATTALAALPAAPQEAKGNASLVRVGSATELRISLTGMPQPSGYYEAWLFDPASGTMYPMGPLTTTGGTLEVSGIDLARFTGVDISVQALDDSGGHGQSMLRGALR